MYIRHTHNVSNLVYHIVCPTKYRRVVLDGRVEGCLRQVCEGIELGWDWIHFLEVGVDQDHVHYLVQSTPAHSPGEIVRVVKSVTARHVFKEHPEVKKKLWGGNFWSEGYFVASVGRFTSENVITEYVRTQGKPKAEYDQLMLRLERP